LLKENQLTCRRCGQLLTDAARVCASCGEPIDGYSSGSESGPAGSAAPAVRRSAVYAGFWLRAVAYLVDSLLLGVVVGFAILMPLMERGAIAKNDPWALLTGALTRQVFAIQLLVTMVSWLYFASFESSIWQATPGKRLLGLVVTNLEGHRISFARASGRYFGKILSGTLFFIGFLIAGFTPRKQALHDLLASCLVLRRPKQG
jgi:uncharacterized RDD family membrane protein YckC